MENKRIDESEEPELVFLIRDLLHGTIEVNYFRQAISRFCEDIVTILFRENFSKFDLVLQENIADTVRRYFFDNTKIEKNEFFKFAPYRGFWLKLKELHDSHKFLDFTFSEILKNFESLFSKSQSINLFRDSFPKFSSSLKLKMSDTFTRYVFSDITINKNEFWQFVNYRDFWTELRKFHDIIYSRNMTLSDIIKFFEQTFYRTLYGLNLSLLEKKIIDMLGKNPSSPCKQLAEDLSISERRVSETLNNLNSCGIFLGGIISYRSMGLHEFFAINRSDDFGVNAVIIDRYLLIPDLNIAHGIMSRKKHGPSFCYVKEKKIYFNPDILNKGLLIQDCKKHPLIKQKNFSVSILDTELKGILTEKYAYIPHLLCNCELDFKQPDIRSIAESHDTSTRTLFRTKSRLVEDKIIQPFIIVENPDLLQMLTISKSELDELYTKVPFIRAYQIQDDSGDTSWLSFVSIFKPDYKYIYSYLRHRAEVFQVTKRQIKDQSQDFSDSSSSGGGLAPYPRDPGDDMTGAAAGMSRKYKDEKKDHS